MASAHAQQLQQRRGDIRAAFIREIRRARRVGPSRDAVLGWLRGTSAATRQDAFSCRDTAAVHAVWSTNLKLTVAGYVQTSDRSAPGDLELLESIDIGAWWTDVKRCPGRCQAKDVLDY